MKYLSANIGKVLNHLRKQNWEETTPHTVVACALEYDISFSNKELAIILDHYLDKKFNEEQIKSMASQTGYAEARREYWHNYTANQYGRRIRMRKMPDDIKLCIDELQQKLDRMFFLLENQEVEQDDIKYYELLVKLLKKMKIEY